MWNLEESGYRFRAAAPNHPEALLEEPQAFQAVGGTTQNRSETWDLAQTHMKQMSEAPLAQHP